MSLCLSKASFIVVIVIILSSHFCIRHYPSDNNQLINLIPDLGRGGSTITVPKEISHKLF